MTRNAILKRHGLTRQQVVMLQTLVRIGGTAFRDDGSPRSREYQALAEAGLVCIDYVRLGEVRLSQAGKTLCDAALIYWRWTCAYCGKSLIQLSMFDDIKIHMDHYIAITDPRTDNPGTVATNMLPSCDFCNHSKNNRNPIEWLTHKFGARKAKRIIARIEAYFACLEVQP